MVLKGVTPPINRQSLRTYYRHMRCTELTLPGRRLLRVADPHMYNVLCAALLSLLVLGQSDAWQGVREAFIVGKH